MLRATTSALRKRQREHRKRGALFRTAVAFHEERWHEFHAVTPICAE